MHKSDIIVTIGMVGCIMLIFNLFSSCYKLILFERLHNYYIDPNVGKSSVVNVLSKKKLVGVGKMPGKTKHFQTIMLEPEL